MSGTAGSVRFGYDANANQRTENAAPYFINGDYVPFTFSSGAHTVTATAFSSANATGLAGLTLSISLLVI